MCFFQCVLGMARFLQQAIAQILTLGYEKYFSDHSMGFRPQRGCHQAIEQVLTYLNEGYEWVIDMDIEKYQNVQGEQNTEQIFSLLYDYLDQYRLQICNILLKNNLEGRCMASLRTFMKNQIRQVISMCPGTKDFPVREDVMVDYYAATLEMLLEKCFFSKEQLSREEALQAVRFLLGSVEKEAHKK